MEDCMSGIEPRRLTNKELVRFAAEMAQDGTMTKSFQIEVVRRLNFYTQGAAVSIADESPRNPNQLELPL